MSPWSWLLWLTVTIIVLSILGFAVSAMVTAIVQSIREGAKCPNCGHKPEKSAPKHTPRHQVREPKPWALDNAQDDNDLKNRIF